MVRHRIDGLESYHAFLATHRYVRHRIDGLEIRVAHPGHV